MGITLAIGVISVFSQYKDSVEETTQEEEAVIAASKVQNVIFELKNSDSGRKTVELPDELGGSDYRVALGDKVYVLTQTKNYTKEVEAKGNFRGSAEGGSVTLYKSQQNYTLRSN